MRRGRCIRERRGAELGGGYEKSIKRYESGRS